MNSLASFSQGSLRWHRGVHAPLQQLQATLQNRKHRTDPLRGIVRHPRGKCGANSASNCRREPQAAPGRPVASEPGVELGGRHYPPRTITQQGELLLRLLARSDAASGYRAEGSHLGDGTYLQHYGLLSRSRPVRARYALALCAYTT